jgi:four helix bundle protein
MNKQEMLNRTMGFHVAVIKACEHLPKTPAGFETAKQLIRAAGSVAANYRAAQRAKSTADFIYKIEIVIEEADESHYWLEILQTSKMLSDEFTNPLLKESNELTSIFVAIAKTAKKNRIGGY